MRVPLNRRSVGHIVIVGGGATGWMTAAYFNRFLPDTQITVVESPIEPTLGVGESLNSISRRFNHALGLKEREFLRAVDGTYKVGIEFNDFAGTDDTFYHPFGVPEDECCGQRDAQEHFLSTHLCRSSRYCPTLACHGYHVCATRYGQLLRDFSVRRGVRHSRRHIDDVRVVGGSIVSVDGLEADLFVDCTGFKSLLLRQALGVEFMPLDDVLLNDAAVAARIPYAVSAHQHFPYTRCSAVEAGWIWNIPLWSRLGVGYCYSSRHIDPDAAAARLCEHARTAHDQSHVRVFHVRFRHGRSRVAHTGNCVALGGAFGFIEPLESTGISLTQASIMALLAHLDDLDAWDQLCQRRFDSTVEFVRAHYSLSHRDDTEYWRDMRALPRSPYLMALIERAKHGDYSSIETDAGSFYRPRNWNVVLSGMRVFDQPSERATFDVDAYPHTHQCLSQIHGD